MNLAPVPAPAPNAGEATGPEAAVAGTLPAVDPGTGATPAPAGMRGFRRRAPQPCRAWVTQGSL